MYEFEPFTWIAAHQPFDQVLDRLSVLVLAGKRDLDERARVGAHRRFVELVRRGHLFLAQPPLYRLSAGAKTLYARDDAHRAELEATEFKGKKVEVSRFKGLGEMIPAQLKETTMDPASRSMIKITLPSQYEDRQPIKDLVERLMGRDPSQRFEFIQARASAVDEEEIDA